MKPRYSFVVPLRDDELDDAINRLYCGCLLSLAERERIAAWMETKRVYAVPEALRSEEPDYKTMYLQLSAQHVRNVEELERELELCRAVTTLCCKKETTPSPLARIKPENHCMAMGAFGSDKRCKFPDCKCPPDDECEPQNCLTKEKS